MKKHNPLSTEINISREEAFKLMEKHNMPINIKQHSIVVNKISLWLADRLIEKGERVNRYLIDIASLLHDIDKIYSIQKNAPHGLKGYEILQDKDKKVADIVRKHVPSAMLNKELHTWEEKIVFYADKRVNSEKIVSLEERYKYLYEKYGSIKKDSMAILNLTYRLEEEIFTSINANPEDIQKL